MPHVHLPLLRTLIHLLEGRVLEAVLPFRCMPQAAGGDTSLLLTIEGEDESLASRIVDCIKPSGRSKDVATLLVASALLLLLLPVLSGGRLTDTWRTVLMLLAHRFPKVRKGVADGLYVHMLTYGEPGELPAHMWRRHRAIAGAV